MTIEEHIIANDVLRNVMDKFKNQQVKGLAKYGETVNPEAYSVEGWLNHIQQEMIDGVVYAEVLINVTSKIVEENKKLKEQLQAKVILVNNGWEEERFALQEEVIKLRETLEFYADETKYEKIENYNNETELYIERDCGEVARKTLEELKNESISKTSRRMVKK